MAAATASEIGEASPRATKISVTSHDTAVCIIPPVRLWPSFDSLRSQHDKAYGKWPPHINLVYPFVNPASLHAAADAISSGIKDYRDSAAPLSSASVCLDSAGVFEHKDRNILFAHDSNQEHVAQLKELRANILSSLGQKANNFNHHLTIGQTEDVNRDTHKFLVSKIELLPPTEWAVEKLYIMQRKRFQIDGNASSKMSIWGTIDLESGDVDKHPEPIDFPDLTQAGREDGTSPEERGKPSYCYSAEKYRWVPHEQPFPEPSPAAMPKNIAVGSYNVLAEFEHPPSEARFPLLLENLFAKSARSDILVLEEVTDQFLAYLVRQEQIQTAFPFASHGPPDQKDVDPLPNHVNIVVLSRFPFHWSWLSLKRRHKGSLIATFPTLGRFVTSEEEGSTPAGTPATTARKCYNPLILATVHLTCGLTDGSVTSKKAELRGLLSHLESRHPRNPWIVAGDFNLSTSAYTIDNLVNNRTIDPKTASTLTGLDNMMADAKLLDTWMVAHLERAHVAEEEEAEAADGQGHSETYRGEQGATFDPIKNPLARLVVGQGFNYRPQRYDRILIRPEGFLNVIGFSRFGFLTGEDDSGEAQYASDHWGVRCGLNLTPEDSAQSIRESARVVPVDFKPAPPSLSSTDDLTSVLTKHGVFPSEADVEARKTAVALLRKILIEEEKEAEKSQFRPNFTEILTAVGSYGVGVWTPSSDVDCMVIGHSSAKTFMAVAAGKLRKAEAAGADVKLLRHVHARTGTMLEISVNGVKMDLQYCSAPAVANNWPQCLRLPANDPAFGLPAQTLMKLKAARDLWFLKGSVPDLHVFRLAYRAVREWARRRGLYAARFGYLGGIHISVLLARVHKMLAADASGAKARGENGSGTGVTAPDLIATFFAHYAAFEWGKDVVFDPFFHRKLRYPRSAQREPLSILGWYAPQLNVAHAASVSSTRTLAAEFRRAAELLGEDGATWSQLLGASEGGDAVDAASEFLGAYKSYVKIDVQYWGLSLSKGSSLVGWLESRCVSLLVDMNLRLPGIHARIWPGRFVKAGDDKSTDPPSRSGAGMKMDAEEGEEEEEEEGEEHREYQGHYLVGLDRWQSSASNGMTKEEEEKTHGTLLAILRRFTDQIQADERYYDANWSYVSADVIRGGKLPAMNLQPDTREWGTYLAVDAAFSDSEDEEDEGEDVSGEDQLPGSQPAARGSKQSTLTLQPLKREGAGKFRTSADVMSRLRWDPSLDSGDYLVGYEDRFLGVMERGLDLWKGERTDEEFIPQHRIVYFKRKTDGEIVWDRRTRKDTLFGSG